MDTWRDGFPKMSTVVPDGAKAGTAEIRHITVSEQDAAFSAMRAAMGRRGSVTAGDVYAQLYVNGTMWMSDTRDERSDHWGIRRNARGHVFIGGLGLGMITLAVALKEGVTKVTVVDINQDVIDLIGPHIRAAVEASGRDVEIEIICADLYEWKPPTGTKYDAIYQDIWADLCTDNLPEYSKLNRKFGKFRTDGGYRGAWGEDLLKRRRARDKREEGRYGRFGW